MILLIPDQGLQLGKLMTGSPELSLSLVGEAELIPWFTEEFSFLLGHKANLQACLWLSGAM